MKTIALLTLAFGGVEACIVPDKFWHAVQQVETGGCVDPSTAVGDGGKSHGWLQISEAVLADVNSMFPEPKYTIADTKDYGRSMEIGRLYLARYCTPARLGRQPTLKDAARIWNGGPDGHRKSSTLKYWKKVQRHI